MAFDEKGVGSRAWYIRAFKLNADRKGFTFIKEISKEDGRTLQFDRIQDDVADLVGSGYLKKIGKPEAPRSDRYEVTSFGHRYLEEHKDELAEAAPADKYEKREDGYYYKNGRMISRLMVPNSELERLDGVKPAKTEHRAMPAITPPPAPEKAPITTRPIATPPLSESAKVLGHAARINSEQGSEEPRINKPAPEHHESKSEPATPPESPKTDNLPNTPPNVAELIKDALGEMLLEKFLDKTLDSVMSFKSISVHDLLEYVEAKK